MLVLVLWGGLAVPGKAHATWQKARDLLRHGRYEQALHIADRLGRGPRLATAGGRAAALVAARAEAALGQLPAARARLERASVHAPENLPMRAELIRLADAVGDRVTVATLVRLCYEDWAAGRVDREDAANLVAMAVAARYHNDWHRANDLLRTAVARAPRSPEPNIVWGQLFMDKHAVREAEESFREALEADPRHPDALVGLARARLGAGYDREGAEDALARARTENPRHPGVLALEAELALDADEFARVEDLIDRLRTINPRDEGAAFLAAALARRRDRPDDYRREKDARLLVNPTDGGFFQRVAEALVRQRRYQDARAVAAEGLTYAPDHAGCLSTLGTTLLRLGEEDEGIERLRRSFDLDPYDVRVFNQLELFEKAIPKRYVIVRTPHFRFRVEPAARPALERIVAPYLESVYRRYVERYRFEPAGPITIELYGSHEDFAVRTVGVPAIDVAAVCFGRVITAQSPTTGASNWGLVLSHELAHVFALAISRERVPRWFTEGLAEVETARLDPLWQRRDDLAVHVALARGKMPELGKLSQAFIRARSAEEAVAAYHYSALAVQFLEARFGWPAVLRALEVFGQGEAEDRVLKTVTGLDTPALGTAFDAHLRERYAGFAKQRFPLRVETPDRPDAERRALARDATRADRARAGLAAFRDGDVDAAARWLGRVRDGAGDDPLVSWLGGLVANKRGDFAEALRLLRPLVTTLDGYELRMQLGLAESLGGGLGEAETHFRAAAVFAPDEVEPWALLSEIYDRTKDPRKRLHARLQAFRREPQDGRLGKEVLKDAVTMGVNDVAIQVGPGVVFVDPSDPEVFEAQGRALLAVGRPSDAATAYEHALTLGHRAPASLHRVLASLYERMGQAAKARAHNALATPSITSPRPPAPASPPPPPKPAPVRAPPLPSRL